MSPVPLGIMASAYSPVPVGGPGIDTVSGSILWLRAKDLGANGSTISPWPDASPAARSVPQTVNSFGPVTVVTNSTPMGGKSALFPGGGAVGPFFQVSNYVLPTDRDGELWIVLKSNDPTNSGAWRFGGNTQDNHYGYSGAVYDDAGTTGRATQPLGTDISQWHIYRVQTSGSTRTVWVNDSIVWQSGATRYWRTDPVVGGAFVTYRLSGNIAELINYSRALTTAEATLVYNALTYEHFTGFRTRRINYAPNPSFETNLTGWTTTGATSARVANTIGGEGSWMAEITGTSSDGFIEMSAKPLSTAGTWTVSARGSIASDHDVSAGRARRIVVFINAGAGYTETYSAPLTTTPGRVSVTVTTPAVVADTIIRLYNNSTTSKKVWWDDVLVEKVATAGPYFSGNTAPVGGKTYEWSAAANASTSYEWTPL